MSVVMLLRLVLLFMVMLFMFNQVLKDFLCGVGDGAEDDGDVNISSIAINMGKVMKNLAKQSYSTMRGSNSPNSISTPGPRTATPIGAAASGAEAASSVVTS